MSLKGAKSEAPDQPAPLGIVLSGSALLALVVCCKLRIHTGNSLNYIVIWLSIMINDFSTECIVGILCKNLCGCSNILWFWRE